MSGVKPTISTKTCSKHSRAKKKTRANPTHHICHIFDDKSKVKTFIFGKNQKIKKCGKSYNRTELIRIKETKNLPLMKDEKEAIRKLLVPLLKGEHFVRISVRVDRLHQKLKTEGVLSPEELSIKHPFHPDIDVLFWKKEYSGEPVIRASEVKYFRMKGDTVYPTIYEGLGEALMLLTFGVDFVCLWHLFDPEIPSEIVSRYRDITQNLIGDTSSPINYQSWLLPEIPPPLPIPQVAPKTSVEVLKLSMEQLRRTTFSLSVTADLNSNPLLNRWDVKIMRSIIKKAYRMVYK